MGTTKDVKNKAEERTTLKKGELWMLRIAAITGVASLISHGSELVGKIS